MTPDDLKALRRQLHLSQAKLAAKLGVDPQTVWRWEAGRNPINRWIARYLRELARSITRRPPTH